MLVRSMLRVGAFILAVATEVAAHPLGNFSINQYSALRIDQQEIEVSYIVDMAEIPTFQEMQESGFVARIDDPCVRPYAAGKAETLRAGLALEVNGRAVVLRTKSYEIIFPGGAGGLPTLKIGMVFKGKLPGATTSVSSLHYRDQNFMGRAGWKEIIAGAGPGVTLLGSSVAESDRSSRLSDYPTDLLNSPPQQTEAHMSFSVIQPHANTSKAPLKPMGAKPEGALTKIEQLAPNHSMANTVSDARSSADEKAAQLKPNSQVTPRNPFTEIIAKEELGWGIVLSALAIAVGLGALHALEPGHGKTLVAAYLVGSRGTFKHAFVLGLIVTAAHTAGVYLLGAITLYASQYIVPERLYPWLGALSGVIIAGLGLALLIQRYRSRDGSSQHHHHGIHHRGAHAHYHHHGHDDHHHHDGRAHHHHHHDFNQTVSVKQLLTLGV